MKARRVFFTVLLLFLFSGCRSKLEPLPPSEVSEGYRGEILGIDKNINEETIDAYLNREDCVYYDMRLLYDPADFSAIGGDSYLSSIIEGFEVLPLPYLLKVENLPQEVGEGYLGRSLYYYDENHQLTSNYEEALDIIHAYFPEDKNIILMCGGGGYANSTRKLLMELGYDETRIYNAGGVWYYQGENLKELEKDEEGNIVDQGIVVHEIDFDELTRTTDSIQIKEKENYNLHKEEIYIDIYSFEDVLKLQEEKADFLIYIYLPGCLSCAEFAPVLREYLEENEMTIYRMNINLASGETNVINRHIRYAPSIAVFNEGDLIAYLDVESEIDLPYYQSTEGLGEWLSQFIK